MYFISDITEGILAMSVIGFTENSQGNRDSFIGALIELEISVGGEDLIRFIIMETRETLYLRYAPEEPNDDGGSFVIATETGLIRIRAKNPEEQQKMTNVVCDASRQHINLWSRIGEDRYDDQREQSRRVEQHHPVEE